MKSPAAFLLAFLLVVPAIAQFNLGFDYYTEFKVVHNGDTLALPWAGGLNNPHFSLADLNLDGNLDVYAFDRDGGVVRTFASDGNGNYGPLMSAHRNMPRFRSKNFVLLRDYNADGKVDIFTPGFNNNRLDIWKNVSDTALKFQLEHDGLTYRRLSGGARDFVFPRNDLPAIFDIDDDGDLDILFQGAYVATGGIPVSGVILFAKNLSQEDSSNNEDVAYKVVENCWGKLREPPAEVGWLLFDCDTFNFTGQSQRHGGPGTTLTPIDLNNDGRIDLLSGDSYTTRLQTLINVGTNTEGVVDLSLSDTTFPSYDQPIFLPNVVSGFYEDFDQDGVKDLLASPSTVSSYAITYKDTSINQNVDWFYKNNGTDNNPDFELTKQGYFSSEMIDVGSRSLPTIVDLTGDGLLDLVVGNEGYTIYGGSVPAKLSFYKNVGTSTTPIFELMDEDFGNVSEEAYNYAHPAFADLDDDGDFDMMIGDDDGRLHYYKNTGTSTSPFFNAVVTNYANINVISHAHPSFFDLNNDDLMDMIIGDDYGQMHYYENAGTPDEADFSQNPTIEKMGDIQVFHDYNLESSCSSTPYFTRKLDSIGTNLYAFLSTSQGTILVYGPISNIYDDYEVSDSIVVEATHTSITGANLFGDFREELVIGQRTGGLYVLNRVKEIGVGVERQEPRDEGFKLFPNPAKGSVELTSNSIEGLATMQMLDVQGRVVLLESISLVKGASTQINLENIPPGAYIVRLELDGVSMHHRLMVQ